MIDFGRHLVSLGLPFGSQNRSKNRSRPPLEHREAPGACPGASGPSKVTKNGAQSEPKTLKIDPLDASRLPKRCPRAPNMESQKHQISKKMDSDLGNQNGPRTNQTSSQTNPKFEPKLDPTWHHPGTKFGFTNEAKCLEKSNVSTRLTQKKGGGGVSP